MKTNPHDTAMDDLDIRREHRFSGASRIILLSTLLFAVLGIWAYFGKLDEVSTGSGKVIPSSREQVLQSLDGGILAELTVREGDKVQANQIVARLDPTRSESNVGESAARYRASLASSARLNAEVNDLPLVFPDSLRAWPDLIASETRLYKSRRAQLADSMAELQDALVSVNKELAITQRLEKSGAASHVEVLRLQRQKRSGIKNHRPALAIFRAGAGSAVKSQRRSGYAGGYFKGREDSVTRLTVRAPMRGIVKNIQVTTIGGVIPPNGEMMEIVPLDDHLLIETRLSPRDIAFIHPGQRALVKITAYDYAIYGGLEGVVETISPDTIQDKVKPEIFYYRVFIRTHQDFLQNKLGRHFSIVPGMIATVDIKTGEKTIVDYLIKPFNRAKEALRER